MSRPGVRTRGNFAQDTVTTEFTTGQIVIMACVALAVACTMFALGVLVGRVDKTTPPATVTAEVEQGAEAAASPAVPTLPAAPTVKVADKAPEPGTPKVSEAAAVAKEAAPADAEAKADTAAAASGKAEEAKTEEAKPIDAKPADAKPVETVVASATPSSSTGTLSETVKPRVTRVEPLPLGPPSGSGATRVTRVEPLPGATATGEPVKITPSEPAAKKPDAAKPAASEEPELMEAMPVPPTKVAAKEPEAKPAEAKKPETKPASTAPPTGKYGIQIASFTGSAGKSKAADYATRIKSTLGYDARVSPSSDGKVYRVVIGGYGDKASAQELCNELKEMAGFKDAFVKSL